MALRTLAGQGPPFETRRAARRPLGRAALSSQLSEDPAVEIIRILRVARGARSWPFLPVHTALDTCEQNLLAVGWIAQPTAFGGSPCTPASKTTDYDHNVPRAFEVVELAIAQLCAGDSQLAKQEVRLLPKD